MNKILRTLTLATVMLFALSAIAHEKVVVIPLGGGKKPTTCTAPGEVLSQGKCWMDRNLGAYRVAINSEDVLAIGDLYQWGRWSDGHQYRSGPTLGNQSPNDAPGHFYFIIGNLDWRTTKNDNLWQGVDGINNPCPTGFRVPTATELENEMLSWESQDAVGAFESSLKLVTGGGYRYYQDGIIITNGTPGYYWSSTVDGVEARQLDFSSTYAGMYTNYRGNGMSIRCIKD